MHRPAAGLLDRLPALRLLALLSDVLVGCASGGDARPAVQDVTVLAPAPYPDLLSLARDLPIPASGSERFVAPPAAALTTFTELLAHGIAGRYREAVTVATGLGYDLMRVAGADAAPLVVIVERASTLRGGGTFVINPRASHKLVIEVPHPLSDTGTLEEGVALFLSAKARLLLIAGTHRCADSGSTPCRGTESTNACGGRLRISDAAHYHLTFFQAAHVHAFRALPASVAVSLHAHAITGVEPDVMLSQGTRQSLPATALANQLRDRLQAMGLAAASCQAASDAPPRLCGEANVQGRVSNGVVDACADEASATGERFLHVEQSPTVLADSAAMVGALTALLTSGGR